MIRTVGRQYEYEPKIWDPQAASETIEPRFSSPQGTLPPWLRWEGGKTLVGVADAPSNPFTVYMVAEVSVSSLVNWIFRTSFLNCTDSQFLDSDKNECTLKDSFTLQAVAPMLPAEPYPQPQMAGWMGMGYPQMVMPPQMQPMAQPMYVSHPMWLVSRIASDKVLTSRMYGMPNDPYMHQALSHPHPGYPPPPPHPHSLSHPNPYNQ